MRRQRLHLLLAAAASIALCSALGKTQENPLSWIPHQVGDRWIYRYVSKNFSGIPGKPEVVRWTSGQTITRLVPINEGLIIERQGWPELARPSHYEYGGWDYLVHGSCTYFLERYVGWGPTGRGLAWDSVKKKLNPGFHEALIHGTVSPAVCFPLEIGKQWGMKSDRPWRVVGRDGGGNLFSPPLPGGAFHIVTMHFASGGRMDVWFKKGTGVVAYHYHHSGTYGESFSRLVRFIPAKGTASPAKAIR